MTKKITPSLTDSFFNGNHPLIQHVSLFYCKNMKKICRPPIKMRKKFIQEYLAFFRERNRYDKREMDTIMIYEYVHLLYELWCYTNSVRDLIDRNRLYYFILSIINNTYAILEHIGYVNKLIIWTCNNPMGTLTSFNCSNNFFCP
jgi:hypothetical protein